jgi:hypothetical protein
MLFFFGYYSDADAGAGNVDGLKDAVVTEELHNFIVGGTIPGESSGPHQLPFGIENCLYIICRHFIRKGRMKISMLTFYMEVGIKIK